MPRDKPLEFTVYVGWKPDRWQARVSPDSIPPSDFADYLKAVRQYAIKTKHPLKEVVFYSNHPDFVDHFDPDNVWVCSKSGKIRRLCEHPLYDCWVDEMGAGQLWSVFGEKWVDEE